VYGAAALPGASNSFGAPAFRHFLLGRIQQREIGLLAESRQKLERVRPMTLGQAGRISGVTPADVQILWVAVKAYHGKAAG